MADDNLLRRDWTIQSELGQEKNVLNELRHMFQALEPHDPRIEEMITAVSEVCLNAIEHGNHLIKDLLVKITLLSQSDCHIFRITDQGMGTNIESIKRVAHVRDKIEWENPRGWGLQLVWQYADSVKTRWAEKEFCVELQFNRLDSRGDNSN